jgi:hypothetical protein
MSMKLLLNKNVKKSLKNASFQTKYTRTKRSMQAIREKLNVPRRT